MGIVVAGHGLYTTRRQDGVASRFSDLRGTVINVAVARLVAVRECTPVLEKGGNETAMDPLRTFVPNGLDDGDEGEFIERSTSA